MDLREAQKVVASFVEAGGLEASVAARLLDLASEVGELAKEHLKRTQYGRGAFAPSADWSAEMGDVLFALICVANGSRVDLEEALQEAVERYRQRLAERGRPDST